nr:MAG TPA: hypothetical protein [Caudoviricetes sp.]
MQPRYMLVKILKKSILYQYQIELYHNQNIYKDH